MYYPQIEGQKTPLIVQSIDQMQIVPGTENKEINAS
jgi:hypothetical protein